MAKSPICSAIAVLKLRRQAIEVWPDQSSCIFHTIFCCRFPLFSFGNTLPPPKNFLGENSDFLILPFLATSAPMSCICFLSEVGVTPPWLRTRWVFEIRILDVWWIKYLCVLESHSLLCTVIRILIVVVTPCSSDVPSVGAYTTSYAWNKSIIKDIKMMNNL